MTNKKNPNLGDIQISKQAIATIAFQAVQRSYGVVGLASKNIADELAHAITKDPTHGIDVEYKNKEINIDIYIIISNPDNGAFYNFPLFQPDHCGFIFRYGVGGCFLCGGVR